MTQKKKKKPTPELKVVFDTNILYTGSESDLVRKDVHDLITQNDHEDVKIHWYLPDVVRHERTFQMQKGARKLLASLDRVERLLGHSLGITAKMLEKYVEEAVKAKEKELGLTRLELDQSRVDLNRLMLDAVYRNPPFEDNEKEKGFRDALIAESFLHLVEDSPKTSARCRLAILTDDSRLEVAIKSRTVDAKNVHILSNVEELQGLINTLVAKVGESFIAVVQPKAEAYFFVPDDESTLYYREKIGDRISAEFADVLEELPEGASSRVNGGWFIYSPNFVKKTGQTVYWSTRVEIKLKAYKSKETPYASPMTTITTTAPYSAVVNPLLPGAETVLSITQPQSDISLAEASKNVLLGDDPYARRARLVDLMGPQRVLTHEGTEIFDVLWSVQVTTADKLMRPRIREIQHVEARWEQV